MRRFDKLQAKIMKAGGRGMAALVVLLLAVWSGTALGQATAPARRAQRRTAPAAPTTQKAPAGQSKPDDMAWLQEALKDPEFMKAVDHLSQRLSNELQYPAMRTQSRILPHLSDSTAFYLAFPNYGDTLRQAQQIFQEELRNSAPLQNFLKKNKLEAGELKFEEGVQKLYELSSYLGDEVVFTGSFEGQEPSGVLVAEVRKPGVKEAVEQLSQQWASGTKEGLRILSPQQLETASDTPGREPVLLLRPDFLALGVSTAALRSMNAQLDKGPSAFMASALGKRLAQSYQGGTGTLMAADLQKLMALVPASPPQNRRMLEMTGFADAQYALLENKLAGKNSTTQMELVFNGPRRSVASWIAAPAPLGALDFLSPKAYLADVVKLKSPALMFDDIVELAGPNAFAMLPQMEAQFNVNLKRDILSKLGGEMAVEIQNPPFPLDASPGHTSVQQPDIKVILSVTDPAGLQRTLKQLLAKAPLQSAESEEDGVTFHSLSTPSGTEVNYFFLDGYLVIASNRALAQEAVRLHRSGESLAHASQIAAQGTPVKASVLVYQNTAPLLAAISKQLPPETAALLPRLAGEGQAASNVLFGYADETSLRGMAKNSVTTDATFGLVMAAIAIPNLLRSRMAANEATAMSILRTVNTAQVTYSVSYPKRGFAPSLAALGPGENGDCTQPGNVSAAHACLLDNAIGNASCTAGQWCVRSGYRFSVRGTCAQERCSGYAATATPVNESTGKKNFCSTSDAVLRSHAGPPLTLPLTVAECRAWAPNR